jgi:predicted nucleic acid-binding protein
MAEPAYLLDTNILLRIVRRDDPDHAIVDRALVQLAMGGSVFCYTHQNIAEFWNVATRPVDRNGFGLEPEEADRQVRLIERGMILLRDEEAIYYEWRRIVLTQKVRGVQVHDARLAASMAVHGLSHLLTLNPTDFERYPGLNVVHPSTVT